MGQVMSETSPVSFPAEVAAELEPLPPPEPPLRPVSFSERTPVLFALFLGVGLVVFLYALLTVHDRPPEQLPKNSGAIRTNLELSHWLHDGYFHDCGLMIAAPLDTVV